MPSGITATGWPAVKGKCADLGIGFDEWQHGTGRLILSKRADGLYATTVGGSVISIPRQVGKTFLVGAIVFALCLLYPNLTVIWTAHRLRTAEETFGKMQGFARRKKIAPHVLKIVLGSGEEEIQFRNGSRILFGARERGFGRGFDEVDVVIYDEAQILTENALDDVVPAMNQSRQPAGALLLFLGTPPKPTDRGEVFAMKRREALSADADDMVYVEFSADEGADPLDRAQWRKANPSFPARTSVAAMLRMRKNLSADSFMREALGVWDGDGKKAALDPDRWLSLADATAERGSPTFGVATAPDRSYSAIGVAWARPDGHTQVMLSDWREGASWVTARVAEIRAAWGGSVLVNPAARGLVEDAEEPSLQEQAQAHNSLADAVGAESVEACTVRHGNEGPLNTAVRAARWRAVGDTRMFDRKGSTDISPLDAVALAAWGHGQGGSVDVLETIW